MCQCIEQLTHICTAPTGNTAAEEEVEKDTPLTFHSEENEEEDQPDTEHDTTLLHQRLCGVDRTPLLHGLPPLPIS